MLTLLSQARFWTLRDDITIKDTDFGAFKYHEKKDSTDSLYRESKKTYAEKRGMTWSVSNKRPHKLKAAIKELDEQVANHRVVHCQWRDDCLLRLMFSTGYIANICVDISTGDVLKISFDKYLVGKLISDYVVDVVFTKTHIVCSYNDNQVTLVYFSKPSARLGVPEKLSRLEPRLQTVELAGPSGRRLERKLSANTSGDTVLVWWRCGRDEVYPWSPVVRDQDRANVHVYSINGTRAQLLCWYRTDHDPVSVSFSVLQPSLILSVEQKVSRKGEVTVESGRYEVTRARLQRTAVTSVPLQTQVCCHSFSPTEDKLLLGCIDGSLVLFDEGRGITHLAKAGFISTLVAWHPEGGLVLAANERCQLQCFDAALASVRHQLAGEEPAPGALLDLAAYSKLQPTLLQMAWARPVPSCPPLHTFAATDSLLLLLLDRGPLTVLRLAGGGPSAGLGVEGLVSQYLLVDQAERAIALLLTLNWDAAGTVCLGCLQRIAEHLFRKPFSAAVSNLLQSALGCFHMPVRPMSPATEVQYVDQVRDMTRRFFHQLLRYQQFEKAFRLAIDLQDRDLFVDLYFYARALNADVMATAAREKAQQLLRPASCSSDVSASDSCTCSESNSSSSESEAQPSADQPPLSLASKAFPTPAGRVPGEKQKVKFSDTVTHIALPESSPSDGPSSPPLLSSSAPLRYVPASAGGIRLPGQRSGWAVGCAEEAPLLSPPSASGLRMTGQRSGWAAGCAEEAPQLSAPSASGLRMTGQRSGWAAGCAEEAPVLSPPSASGLRMTGQRSGWAAGCAEGAPLLGQPSVAARPASYLPAQLRAAHVLANPADAYLQHLTRAVPQYQYRPVRPPASGGLRNPAVQNQSASRTFLSTPDLTLAGLPQQNPRPYLSPLRHSPGNRFGSSLYVPSYSPPILTGSVFPVGAKEVPPRAVPRLTWNSPVSTSLYSGSKDSLPHASSLGLKSSFSHSLNYQRLLQNSEDKILRATPCLPSSGVGSSSLAASGPSVGMVSNRRANIRMPSQLGVSQPEPNSHQPCKRDIAADGVDEDENLHNGNIKVVHFGVV